MKKLIFLFFFSLLLSSSYKSIYEIQGQTSSSPYVNQVVTTSGIVTAVGTSGFFLQEKNPNPAWRGIYVYTSTQPSLSIGDSITITDTVKEFFGLTEIKSINHNYTLISQTTPPEPYPFSTGEVAQEMWEGVLVEVQNALCISLSDGDWIVNDGSGEIRIGNLFYSYSPTLKRKYKITGPVYFSSYFKITPRNASDIKGYPFIKNVIRRPGYTTFIDDATIIAKIINESQIIGDTLFYKVNSNQYIKKTHDSTLQEYFFYSIPKGNKNDTIFYYVTCINESLFKDTSRIYSYVIKDTTNIQFNVMTYNILNFPSNTSYRLGYMMKIFRTIIPDVLIIQELQNELGADLILDSLLTISDDYTRAEFIQTPNDPTSNNMLFYRNSIGSLISQDTICTDLRNINEYKMEINKNEVYFYSCHLKASDDPSSQNQRLYEVTLLRTHLNTLPPFSEFIIVGDMNFYYSNEPGYQKFIQDENDNGRCIDLLGVAGAWHDNSSFAPYHTQSTRIAQLSDGGSSGGLDDRFDFIFANYNLNNSYGIEYIQNTYKAYGNDGRHFNDSIISGGNDSVPDSIAVALYYASDHLPVIAEFLSLNNIGGIEEKDDKDLYVELLPNGIKIKGTSGDTINIYDVLGRMRKEVILNENETFLNFKNGIFFIRSKRYSKTKKVIVL